MTKTALANHLVDQYGYTPKAAKTVIEAIFNRITTALLDGDNVQILGFGTFKVNTRRARIGCNPRTGEDIQLPETHYVHFKQSTYFKGVLNK